MHPSGIVGAQFIHGFGGNHADRYKEGRRYRCAGDPAPFSSTSQSPPRGDGSFTPCARFLCSVYWPRWYWFGL